MKNKYFKIFLLIAILLVLSLTTLASYAYFVANVNGNDSAYDTVITTGEMALMLNDGEQVSLSNAIPGNSVTKEFKVKNTGTVDTTYDVYFSELFNEFEDKNDLVYKLTSENGCTDNKEKVVPGESSEQSKIVNTCNIKPNEEDTYTLTITFKDDGTNQDNNKGKRFSTKISVNEFKKALKVGRLIEGSKINNQLYAFTNYNVENIENVLTSDTRPDANINTLKISTDNSLYDVIIWYDDSSKTLYFYTDADEIYLNESSSSLFSYFSSVQTIDLSKFNSSDVTNMQNMFYGAKATNIIFGDNFDTSNVTNFESMFQNTNCNSYDFINNFDFSSAERMYKFLGGTKSVEDLVLHDLDFTNVKDMKYMFDSASFKSITFRNISAPNVEEINYMFKKMQNLESIDFGDNFNAENLIGTYYLVYDTPNLVSIDFGNNFNPKKIKKLNHLVANAPKLTSINLGNNFITSSLTEISDVFYGLDSIETIDLGDKFDTSKAERIYGLASNCKNLKSIHLGNKFYVSANASISPLIVNCANLTTIYAGPNSYVEPSNTSYVFDTYSTNIIGGAGTSFNVDNKDAKYAHIDDGASNPGYYTLDPKYS